MIGFQTTTKVFKEKFMYGYKITVKAKNIKAVVTNTTQHGQTVLGDPAKI